MKNKIAIVASFLAVMFAMTGMAVAANISGMKFNDLNHNGIKDSGEPGLANWTITRTSLGQEFPITTLTDSNGNYIFSELAPGNYTVGEILQAGWEQTAPPGGTYNIALTGVDVVDKDFGNFNASQPIIVGEPVTPVILNIDLRTLPVGHPWQEGEPIIESPGQPEPGIGALEQSGTGGPQSGTGGLQSGTGGPQGGTGVKSNTGSAQVSIDPLSAPILNFDGIPATGYVPPDTVGDVGPNHYIQAVNARFAIFDKAGNWLVGFPGGVDINQLWIAAGQGGTPCGINNNGDPNVKYDRLADRWVISQFVAFNRFCFAVSMTPDPVAGGWALYDFTSGGILNDYPKLGVWPDAYYVSTNNGAGAGHAWAFDRTNMLSGGVASPPVAFFAGSGFMLPSDLYGTTPPPGAPNVFVKAIDGADFGGVDRLELIEFDDPFGVPTFTPLPNLPTAAFNWQFCGFYNFRIPCTPQLAPGETLDVLERELMYRLQYRNFGSYETLVLTHDINVGGNQAGNRWYELRKVGGTWSIFQQATNAPDATNRWMGSIAMDKDGNMAMGYSVSSTTVFPGIRYTGRLASDPLNTLQPESTLIAGGGSQTAGFNRWGDYSSMTVDPVDDCTFWYTSEYYPITSTAGWHTRIGSFSFSSCTAASISGMKFNDLNGNGINDAEPGLNGWTITLTGPSGPMSTVTSGGGKYEFKGLAAGTYTIGEVLLPGWKQTAPAGGTYTVTISPGQIVTGKDFGNKKFSIFGMKFNDKNNNKKRDIGEEGLAGWHIRLIGVDTLTTTPVNREEITDANGNYGFMDVTPGIYQVFEVMQRPNWVPTTSVTVPINLKAGETINVNFGNRKIP